MKKTIPSCFLALLSLATFCGHQLYAQENPAASAFKARKINVKDVEVYQGIMDFVPVAERSAVAFARNKILVPKTKFNLISFTLSEKGKSSIPVQISDEEGLPLCASAVWLGNGPQEPASEEGRGFVFVLFSNTTKISGEEPETAFFSCAEFNQAGDILGGWRILATLESDPGTYLSSYSIRAVRGGDRIGIAYSVDFWHWSDPYYGPVESMLYLAETDFDGTPIGEPTSLKIFNGGKKQHAKTHDVIWNGERWLVASAVTRQKIVNSQIATLMNEVVIHSLTTGDHRKAMSRQLVAGKDPNLFAYESISFAPPSPFAAPPALRVLTYLLVDSLIATDYNPDSIINMDSIYALYRIDWRGKKIERPLALNMPPLSHKIKIDPGQSVNRNFDYASRLLPTPADAAPAQTSGFQPSQLLFSRAFTVWLYSIEGGQYKYEYEQTLALYSLEPGSGEVKLISEGNYSWIRAICQHPLLGWMRGAPVVINDSYIDVHPYRHDSYFSRFAQ